MREESRTIAGTSAAVLLGLAWGGAAHAGADYSTTLTDPITGYQAVVDPSGVVQWTVPNVATQRTTHYYRVGASGPAIPFTSLDLGSIESFDDQRVTYHYGVPGYDIGISLFYDLGSNRIDTEMELRDATFGSNAGENIHLFQLTDFDLLNTPEDDIVRVSSSEGLFRDGVGTPASAFAYWEGLSSGIGTTYEAGTPLGLAAKLLGPTTPVLDTSNTGEAYDLQGENLAFAHEWVFFLETGPDPNEQRVLTSSVVGIPAPSAALAGLAMLGVVGARRRR